MAQFAEGDTVLAYHGPMIYEAKVVKVQEEGGSITFFVHYLGWNKKWDEWVEDHR
jgi:mortality factor 4-like protein 1